MEVVGVTESAFKDLTNKILLGGLQSGQRINELHLSEALGISRPPLREAMRRLESHRLIRSVPRKGSFVSDLSPENFDEIIEARFMIEAQAIDILAARNVEFDKLKKSIEKTSFQLPGLEARLKANPEIIVEIWQTITDFHFAMIELCNNQYLIDFYQTLSLNLARYQILFFQKTESLEHALDDHRGILNFIEAEKPAKAKALLVKHINLMDTIKPMILE